LRGQKEGQKGQKGVQKGGSSAATSCQPEIVGQLAGIELERPLHTRRHNLVTVGGRVWLEQTGI